MSYVVYFVTNKVKLNQLKLTTSRSSTKAIVVGYDIMVYGGHYNSQVDTDYAIQAERCSLIGDRVNCIEQEPTVDHLDLPALFLVGEQECL